MNSSLLRPRILALSIDSALAYVLLPALPILITTRLEGNWWDWILVWGLTFHALHVLAGQLFWGKTLGKRIAGISIFNTGGHRYGLRLVIREAVRAVSILIIVMGLFFFPIAGMAAVVSQGWNPPGAIFPAPFIILGYLLLFGPLLATIFLPPLLGDNERALHDHIANTAVALGGKVERYLEGYAAVTPSRLNPELLSGSDQTGGPGVRIGAAVIDFVIVGLLIGATIAITNLLTGRDLPAGRAFFLLLYPLLLIYSTLMQAASGATFGKKAYQLVVVGMAGTRIGWWQSLVREIVRTGPSGVAMALPILFNVEIAMLIGLLVVVVIGSRDDRRGLHDLAARTRVILRNPAHSLSPQRGEGQEEDGQ